MGMPNALGIARGLALFQPQPEAQVRPRFLARMNFRKHFADRARLIVNGPSTEPSLL